MIQYLGTSIANFKAVKVAPGVNVSLLSSKTISIGLGLYTIEHTGWDAEAIATLWNTASNALLNEIVAVANEDDSITFTQNNSGQDFELTVLIDGDALQVSTLQKLVFSPTPSGGTFTLSDGTLTTGAITWSGTPSTLVTNITNAINALAGYTSGDVVVTTLTATDYQLDFSSGRFAGLPVSLWTVVSSSLTGGNAGITIATTQQGNAGTNAVVELSFPVTGDLTGKEVQTITLSGTEVRGATWTLSLDEGSTFTNPISSSATAKQVQIAIEETFTLTPEDITVFGPAGGPFLVYWADETDHPLIEVDEQQASSTGGTIVTGTRDNLGWYRASDSTWLDGYMAVTQTPTPDIGFMQFHASSLPTGAEIASAVMSLRLEALNPPTVALTVTVTAYDGGHDAPWPANAGNAATYLAASGAASTSFVVPIFTGVESQTVSFDIANVLQQAIEQASYVAGDNILLFFSIASAGIDGFTNTVSGGSGAWSLTIDYGTAVSTDLAAAVTLVEDGGTLSQAITGGTFNLSIVGPSTVNVSGIAYNASSATVVSAINTAAGATIVSGTGGALPATAVALTFINTFEKTPVTLTATSAFSGVFAGAITQEIVRAGTAPKEALNVWDMTICPGQGTLGVDPSPTGEHNFFVISIIEPTSQMSDATVLDTQTSVALSQKKIYVRLYDINAMRIQRAINEAYAADVCRVTRITHSHEWRRIIDPTIVSGGFGVAQPFYCWYYRDVYRIVFVNRFADAATIEAVTVSSAPVSSEDSTATGPDAWMVGSQTLPVTTLPYDLSNEVGRTYQGFVAMAAEAEPLHIFSVSRCTEDVSNLLSFRFKLAAQYGTSPQDALTAPTDYSGITTQLVGYGINFRWVKLQKESAAETATEVAGGTTLAVSVDVPWDATNEQIVAAIESLDEAFVGNVQVTGSLVNSWKPETYTDLDDSDEDYDDLLVTFTNKLAYLPLNEQWYALRMGVTTPTYFTTDTSYTRKITNLSELFSVPLPPFKNQRIRYTMLGSASYVISYDGTTVSLTQSASITTIQAAFNQLLGSFTSTAVSDAYTKSVRVYGVPFSQGSWEAEFTGFGYQQSEAPAGLIVGTNGLALITTTTAGVAPISEVETLVITGTPHSGTYTITGTPGTTGSLAYNANAAAIQTAIRLLTGYTAVTVTGTWPNFTVTFPTSLGNVTQLTATPSLNNAAATVVFTQQGGPDSQLSVFDAIPGRGPSYYDVAANYSPQTVPGSGDVLIYDNAATPVYFGLDQTSVIKVASLSTSSFRHQRNRKVLCDGQKVRFLTTGTAPAGLTDGDEYFIINALDTYQFQLSETLDGAAVSITSVGTGVHSLQVEEVEVQVFNRYSGGTIGLPIRRSNGLLEYLPLYLFIPGMDVTFGFTADEGNGVSMFKGNTGDLESHVLVNQTGQASSNLPAVFLLFNHADSTLEMLDGSVGIAFYTGESSLLDSVIEHRGELTMCNTDLNTLSAGGRDVASQLLRECTIGSTVNI